jgi:hypothetical protein
MSEQTEVFGMSKEEATRLLIEKEAERMRLENEIEGQRELIKSYREALSKITDQINQLTIVCNKAGE